MLVNFFLKSLQKSKCKKCTLFFWFFLIFYFLFFMLSPFFHYPLLSTCLQKQTDRTRHLKKLKKENIFKLDPDF